MVDSPIFKYRQLFDGTLLEKRSTYANDVDQLAAIQLSYISVQKSTSQQKALSANYLFMLQRKINLNKNGSLNILNTPLKSEVLNIVSFEDLYASYVSFTKHCNIIDKTDVDIFLNSKEQEKSGREEKLENQEDGTLFAETNILLTPLLKKYSKTSSQLNQRTPNNLCASSLQSPQHTHTALTPFPPSPKNSSNIQLRSIIISYFQLIVNSRNEIALARIIDEPSRGIDHKSFTDIRKSALDKGMPMYQVISSFVRQVALGGKGYAPNEHHSLFEHKGGLIEFMELMDKLQTIVDEGELISNVLTALFKALKLAFIRAKDPVFSSKTVSIVIQDLSNVIKSQFLKNVNNKNTDMCFLLRDFVDFMSSITGNEVSPHSSQLCGILSTPEISFSALKKISTLVTKFNTPGIEETPKKSKEVVTDDENTEILEGVVAIDKSTPIASLIPDADENNKGLANTSITPSSKPVTLIRCKNTFVEENIKKNKIGDLFSKQNKEEKEQPKEEVSNVKEKKTEKPAAKKECPPMKKRANVAKKEKAKCVKKIKLLSGQKTLSQFFTK